MEKIRDWWNQTGGYPQGGYYDSNHNRQRDLNEPLIDGDLDLIPDSRESALGYDSTERNTFNQPGADMWDEHHHAYEVGEKWQKGSSDSEDWAYPGKQYPF